MKVEGDAGYYEWREFEARAGDQVIRYAAKPGLADWDRVDHGACLLAESIEVGQGDRLIHFHAGAGIAVASAALRGAQATARDDNIVAVEAARRTLALNGVASSMPAPVYDVAAVTLPKARDVVRRALADAARTLKPGGRIYLVGANRSGIKSAIDDLHSIFGAAEVVAYGKGHRVAVAVRPDRVAENDGDGFAETQVDVRGSRWRVVSGPGVFARDRLDEGTRRLIEAMTFRAGESLLDLGCGCGIVGLVAAQMGSRVTYVDANAAAIEATRRTLTANGIRDADVIWSDCASAVADRHFDVVATNPPFHQGGGTDYLVARQFVRDADRVLRPGGRLFLVANRFLRYEREMSGLFSDARVIFEDGRFRVFEAVK
ncbi:MAG TPA: methyltransferase [Anaerolineae bacterium]